MPEAIPLLACVSASTVCFVVCKFPPMLCPVHSPWLTTASGNPPVGALRERDIRRGRSHSWWMARSASSISRRNGWSRFALWSSRGASSRTPLPRSSPRMLNCWRSGVRNPGKRGAGRSEWTTIQHPRGTPERLTMGLTLSEETSNRVNEVVLPPRLGSNEECHCGSGIKYKRCCRERDQALRRQLRGAALPEWIDNSRSKLRQFEKYVCNAFALPDLLASLTDQGETPKFPPST